MLVDPTFLLTVFCLIAVVVGPFAPKDLTFEKILYEYVLSPPMIFGISSTILLYFGVAFPNRKKLSTATKLKSNWFLLNAIWFHFLMDFWAGLKIKGGIPYLTQAYHLVDPRFSYFHFYFLICFVFACVKKNRRNFSQKKNTQLHSNTNIRRYERQYADAAGGVAYMTSVLELWCEAPFALLAFLSYHWPSLRPYQISFEIICSMAQLVGTWYFNGVEVG